MKIEDGTNDSFDSLNNIDIEQTYAILESDYTGVKQMGNEKRFDQRDAAKTRGRPRKENARINLSGDAVSVTAELTQKDLATLENLAKYGFSLRAVIAAGLEHITAEFKEANL
jgi:hypothetical protein